MQRSTVAALTAAIGAFGLATAAGPARLAAQGMITAPSPPQAEAAGERPVSYSQAQAHSGRAAYDRQCAMCHGENLDDGEFGGPPLRGTAFERTFGDVPVSVLYGYIEATMPPDRPGQMAPSERTDIVAYILARNGYAPGAPLPSDIEAMGGLILRK